MTANQKRNLCLFLLSVLASCAFNLVVRGPFIAPASVVRCGLLGLYFFLCLWVLGDWLKNFGLAFLLALAGLLLLGATGLFILFLAAVAALADGFLYSLYKSFRKNKPALKSWLIGFLEVGLLLFFGVLLGILSNSGYFHWLYVTPSVNTTVQTALVHPDTLYHAGLANMLVNYQVVSMGANGLTPHTYHVFSHLVYGLLARLVELKPLDLYGNGTTQLFIPLLFLVILNFSEELFPRRGRLSFYMTPLLLLSVFWGFIGRVQLYQCTGWDSYFVSESYLIFLILLFAFLSYYHRQHNPLVTAVFLTMMAASKISGLILFPAVLLIETLRLPLPRQMPGSFNLWTAWLKANLGAWLKWVLRCASFSLLAVVLYVQFFPSTYSSQGIFEPAFFFNNYFDLETCELQILGGVYPALQISFFYHHFYFVWIGLLLLTALYLWNPARFIHGVEWLVVWFTFIILGLLSVNLSISGGSGYYISNVGMFLALPVILASANIFSSDTLEIIYRTRMRVVDLLLHGAGQAVLNRAYWRPFWRSAAAGVVIIVCTYGVLGCFLNGLPLMTLVELPRLNDRGRGFETLMGGYIRQLQAISTDPSTRHYLVYIPKRHTAYWQDVRCERPSFAIPAVSGRPALFGLPLKNCRVEILPETGELEFMGSTFPAYLAQPEPTPEQLCEETRRLGFAGYLEVSHEDVTRMECPQK